MTSFPGSMLFIRGENRWELCPRIIVTYFHGFNWCVWIKSCRTDFKNQMTFTFRDLNSFHFSFLVFGHENTKILHNLCIHFTRQDGQDRKNWKKVTQLKWPKYQRPKDENTGWTKHLRYWITHHHQQCLLPNVLRRSLVVVLCK